MSSRTTYACDRCLEEIADGATMVQAWVTISYPQQLNVDGKPTNSVQRHYCGTCCGSLLHLVGVVLHVEKPAAAPAAMPHNEKGAKRDA